MGRPGPKKGWADLGPEGIGLISAQQSLLISSGPDLAQTAGMGQNQSGPKTHGWPETVWPKKKNQQGPESQGGLELAAGGEKRERESWLQEKPGRKNLFCANFELPKKSPLSMKIAPIYRPGKRVILSSMGKTSQPLIRLE